jgi:NAD(P)H dehydrogenase (quinone)
MNNPLILITGATGATGGFAIDQLLAKGARLRAFVHKEDERAARLRERGVQVVVGSLENFQDVRAAMTGVYSAYFVYPLDAQILKATAYFAQAAKEAGVRAVVNISQRTAHIDSASHSAQDHWIAERVFDWSDVPVIHLRPTLFMEWLLYPFQLPIIAQHGMLMLPGGKGRHAPVAAYDQGRVIATILQNPTPHIGRTYHLYGPEELNYFDIASEVGHAIGRQIHYVPESREAFEKRLTEVGVPAYVVGHLTAVFDEYRNNLLEGSNNTIETITGLAPMSIREFALQHADLLRNGS